MVRPSFVLDEDGYENQIFSILNIKWCALELASFWRENVIIVLISLRVLARMS